MPRIKAAIESLPSAEVGRWRKREEPVRIQVDGEELVIEREEVKVDSSPREGFAVGTEGDVFVALSLNITDDLRQEGLARELVHRIQRMRRDAGFEISDRIRISYQAAGALKEVIDSQGAYIAEETLCEHLAEDEEKGEHSESLEIDGEKAEIAISRLKR